MFSAINSKKQGDIGLSKAIHWFTVSGYTVCIPLTDSQDYDLIVEIEGKISRVQIKTTSFKRNNSFNVNLSVKGGNRTGTGKVKYLNPSTIDSVFIVTSEHDMYLIPVDKLTSVSTMSLRKYSEYKVL